MSAGILLNDTVVATEPTWHRLETIVECVHFANSGLDWLVTPSPVYGGKPIIQIPNHQLLTAPTKDGSGSVPLAIMKSRYTPIQNHQVWESMEKALKGIGYEVTCVGSLDDRSKVFLSIRLTDKGAGGISVAGDKYKSNLNFLTSHDGSGSYYIFDSAVRVVCKNTFNMAMAARTSSNIKHSARHTSGNAFKIEGIVRDIQKALEGRKIFKDECEKMAKIRCDEGMAMEFVVGLMFPPSRPKPSPAVMETAYAITDAFKRGDGNNGQTRYDLFNGVTQFYTRCTTRSDSDSYSSGFIGLGAKRKGEAFDILTDDVRFKKVTAHGRAGMALLA